MSVTLKYETVANKLNELIDTGVYEPGERLPSIRELHSQFDVSLNTIREAYRVLENRGIVEAISQSGHYVRQGPPLCTDPLSEDPGELIAGGAIEIQESALVTRMLHDVSRSGTTHVSGAEPPLELLPLSSVAKSVARVVRTHRDDALRYGTVDGPLELRQEIAKRMFRAQMSVAPEDILVTSGCLDAISLALKAVTEPGDSVVIESPAFYLFFPLLKHLHLKAIEVPDLCSDGIDPDALEDALRNAARHSQRVSAAVLIGNFSNPTGSLLTDESKRRIGSILARYGVVLIEDDIYGELSFGRHRPSAVAAFADPERAVYCSSFSKTVAPGLRVGWVAAGDRMLAKLRSIKLVSSFAAATPNALAVADFLARGDFDRALRRARVQYQTNAALAREAVCRYFPSGTTATRPMGGMVFWVALPQQIDVLGLYDSALAAGVAFAPGAAFTTSSNYTSHLRITATRFDGAIETALEKLGTLARTARERPAKTHVVGRDE